MHMSVPEPAGVPVPVAVPEGALVPVTDSKVIPVPVSDTGPAFHLPYPMDRCAVLRLPGSYYTCLLDLGCHSAS